MNGNGIIPAFTSTRGWGGLCGSEGTQTSVDMKQDIRGGVQHLAHHRNSVFYCLPLCLLKQTSEQLLADKRHSG